MYSERGRIQDYGGGRPQSAAKSCPFTFFLDFLHFLFCDLKHVDPFQDPEPGDGEEEEDKKKKEAKKENGKKDGKEEKSKDAKEEKKQEQTNARIFID